MALNLSHIYTELCGFFIATLHIKDFTLKRERKDLLVASNRITLKNLNQEVYVSISVSETGKLDVTFLFDKKLPGGRHYYAANTFNRESPWLTAYVRNDDRLVVRYTVKPLNKKEVIPNVEGAFNQIVSDKVTKNLKELLKL